jgi:hypothetical protein
MSGLSTPAVIGLFAVAAAATWVAGMALASTVAAASAGNLGPARPTGRAVSFRRVRELDTLGAVSP